MSRIALALVLAAGCRGKLVLDSAEHDSAAPTDTPTDTEPVDTGDSRVDTDDTEPTTPPSPDAPWLRDEVVSPGSVSFSELMYHPPEADGVEWIELNNPMALDMDLSRWRLDGAVSFVFPEGTVVPAGGYAVIASDPAALADAGVTDALGPFDGRLDNAGERLELLDLTGRRIDSVGYGDRDPWPVAPDGSGAALAKIDADSASDRAEHWAPSASIGGTPGEPNQLDPHAPPVVLTLVPWDATWAYDTSGAEPAADWAGPAYDDGAWPIGEAPFFYGDATLPADGTIYVTADNYYAVYLGAADGSDLRLAAEDADGSWTTVEAFALEVQPDDHLFLAAWEARGDSGSTQMVIAEVTLPERTVGTDIAGFEQVLGPADATPGASPPAPAPDVADIAAAIADADAAGLWAPPGVEASRLTSPWGGTVGGAYTDAAQFIWADTFDNNSDTNRTETWALFRSRDPLLGPTGTTALPALPTTTLFRTAFPFHGDPDRAALLLTCALDDGAVIYLNGVEVLRENLPGGAIGASTRATDAVDPPTTLTVAIPADALVAGPNVLAAEVHQASDPEADLSFACELTATLSAEVAGPTVVLSELAPTGDDPWWVELDNVTAGALPLGGLVLATSSGDTFALPDDDLAPDALRILDDPGLDVADGDAIFLTDPTAGVVLDAVRAGPGGRARDGEAGPWRTPSAPTPGDPNAVAHTDGVVVNELMYHRAPLSEEGVAFADRDEEWIELFHRGDDPVDLSGWQLVDAVAYTFPDGTTLAPGAYLVIAADPAAVAAAHPEADVVGPFEGRLDNRSDRVLLLDAWGNPADEVRYHDGGRWPDAADGGGSSLELRDAWADNAAPEAWAAGDEADRAGWTEIRYRGVATPSAVGPDGTWEELVIGLLDAGEVLLDDVSVVEDPDGAARQLVTDGGFDAGGTAWRLLGTHRHSAVVPDPDDASNPVLRLVATGATGHMHNHAELTLTRDIAQVEYEISLRARWVSGSNQLLTRLYFNRLPRTSLVPQPTLSGTPGTANTAAVENLGPTFDGLAPDVAVPAAGSPVTLTTTVHDPDGVDSVTLWSSVDGGAWASSPMTEAAPGVFRGVLPGQDAGAIAQIYVDAVDARGERATFPAAGPDSRALLTWDDGQAADNGLHNVRLLMTASDAAWLHDDVNLMSDDPVGATVIYDERTVFFDVGVRAKGSERGRPTTSRLGYAVSFHAEQPFRGSRRSALIDRSEGTGYGQREVLLNLVQTHAGSVAGEYNDLIQAITPYAEHTGAAELQLDRATDLVLAAQFQDGDAGELFEYELIYYPYTTDDGTPEGAKLPQPDGVIGTTLRDLGDDREAYRWNFLLSNNEREDDYSQLMALCQTFDLPDADLVAAASDVLDVDLWLRAFAFATLAGVVDQYGGDGSQHNARFYFRPTDGRAVYLPHDLDYFGSSTMAIVGNNDLRALIADPVYKRAFYGHLVDIVDHAYNPTHLQPWCDQMATLLPAQPISSHCSFIGTRSDYVMYDATDAVTRAIPQVDFQITTSGGADFEVAAADATLQGTGWVDVAAISRDGVALDVTWLAEDSWQVTVALEPGDNPIELVATNLRGELVATDTITITSTGG